MAGFLTQRPYTQRPQNVTNIYNPPAPSGGGCGTVLMECHNHGYRNEGDVPQGLGGNDPSFAYGGRFLMPDSNTRIRR